MFDPFIIPGYIALSMLMSMLLMTASGPGKLNMNSDFIIGLVFMICVVIWPLILAGNILVGMVHCLGTLVRWVIGLFVSI